ncbi:MAG: TIM-barrel domain-containing protein [Bacteroidales bacterium]
MIKLRIVSLCILLLTGLNTLLAKNPVVIGNARFTFISEGLVRLEYAEDQEFLDDQTLFAFDRSHTYDNVQIEQNGQRYKLSTPKMRVEYLDNGSPFGQITLSVYYMKNGKEHQWKTHSGQHSNLGGSLTTLDGMGGEVPIDEGLLSKDGWYMINDTDKDILQNGWIKQRSSKHIQDYYLFVYDNDYKAALKDLQRISGPVPMTRKYIHGSWYCRWWNYTAEEYKDLVAGYQQHNFPLDIVVFDMGWHTQREAKVGTGHAGNTGWTGYTWNKKLIAEPEKLIRDFKKDGIHVVLNEHPHDGLRPHEDAYTDFMNALGKDPVSSPVPLFNAGDKRYMDAFMKYAHKESDDMGVAFWWLDWQQDYVFPSVRGTKTKHLPWLNHIYFNYSKQNNLRGAGFSRWAGWVDHRNPIQFSGDEVGNWDMLRFQVKLTATSGNVGCFFWAHDIGGFFDGTDPELYTRWTQFGLLNSSLRIHSVYDEKLDRRPWLWGKREENAMRRIYHTRSEMMPYIYSSVRECHKDMLPLNRAMYIEYPEENEAYSNPQQFMFGSLLLGAPVTASGKGNEKEATQKVWLPKGNDWYDFFTGKRYSGGTTIEESYPLERFPLFVKGGYPLPMQPVRMRMATAPLDTLVVRLYPDTGNCDNSYTLYEDDGETVAYEKGEYATTRLQFRSTAKSNELIIHPVEGSYTGQLRSRAYQIVLGGFATVRNVKINGRKTKATSKDGFTVVSIPENSITKMMKITWN